MSFKNEHVESSYLEAFSNNRPMKFIHMYSAMVPLVLRPYCIWLRAAFCGLMFVISNAPMAAGQDAESGSARTMLQNDFPVLWGSLGDKALKQKADYVILIDVSGTMKSFKETVVDGLSTFLSSLPEGDYVSLVKFGTTAQTIGNPAPVTQSTRQTILDNLAAVQFNEADTDMEAMANLALDELNRPGGSNLKFVFAFTDFLHDPPKSRKGKERWEELARRFQGEQGGRHVEFYAIKLPLDKNAGRDLPLIESIFPSIKVIPAERTTLKAWFERRKAEILRDRLRIVVEREMDSVQPSTTANVGHNRLDLKLGKVGSTLFQGLELTNITFPADSSSLLQTATLPIRLDESSSRATLAHPAKGGVEKADFEVGEIVVEGKVMFHPESELTRIGLATSREWKSSVSTDRRLSTGRFSPSMILLFKACLGVLGLLLLLLIIKVVRSLLPKPLYGTIEWRMATQSGKRELDGTRIDLASIGVTGWLPAKKHVLVNRDEEVCLVSGDNEPRALKRDIAFTLEGATFTFKSQS